MGVPLARSNHGRQSYLFMGNKKWGKGPIFKSKNNSRYAEIKPKKYISEIVH